jgi:hypothetical protein
MCTNKINTLKSNQLAAQTCNIDSIRILLAAGADPKARDSLFSTAYDIGKFLIS